MRVGVDATSWVNRRGYGRFARNAVSRLIELDAENAYVLFIDEASAADVPLPPLAERREVPLRRAPARATGASSSRGPTDLFRLARATRGHGLDVFLFPSVYTYFPVSGIPTVVGVHDTIADDFPELTLPSARDRMFWRIKERVAVRRATRLFTVSEASRRALADRFGLPLEGVAIVPEAPDPVFFPRAPETVARGLASIDLAHEKPFLLFAGGVSPHKNLPTLLDAYARLVRSRATPPRLVLVGDLASDPYLSAASDVRDQIERLGLQSSVVLPGFVSDETLACLYTAAAAVVLPSLAEGFGLPAVEAAACGAPTILSDLPAHRETLGDDALYFPPTDSIALAHVLARILDDEAIRESLGERGRRAVSRLSWDRSAERLRDLVVDAARR